MPETYFISLKALKQQFFKMADAGDIDETKSSSSAISTTGREAAWPSD